MLKRLQARLVDAIKRRAIARLHATAEGEALLLEIYLWAEEGAENEGLAGIPVPSWLVEQLGRQRDEEQHHAALLRQRLRELGHEPRAARIDVLSRFKLARLKRLARRAPGDFREGPCVPWLAVALRMEVMGVRVLGRHVEVLRDFPGRPPALELLERILADERGHVAACARALERLVPADEQAQLAALVERIDATERAFGVTGALALAAISLFVGKAVPARAAVPA